MRTQLRMMDTELDIVRARLVVVVVVIVVVDFIFISFVGIVFAVF